VCCMQAYNKHSLSFNMSRDIDVMLPMCVVCRRTTNTHCCLTCHVTLTCHVANVCCMQAYNKHSLSFNMSRDTDTSCCLCVLYAGVPTATQRLAAEKFD